MKKLILLMALAMIVGLPADAKRKKKKESKAEKKEAPVRQGLFSVQKDGDKWFFLVPDSLMGSPFLAITRYVSTPSGAGIYGGEEVNEQTFYWEKADGRLLLRSLVYLSVADSTQAIARAVKASAQDPIVESFKIEATKKDSAGNQSYKVEIGRLFAKENVAVGLDANSKKRQHRDKDRAHLQLQGRGEHPGRPGGRGRHVRDEHIVRTAAQGAYAQASV